MPKSSKSVLFATISLFLVITVVDSAAPRVHAHVEGSADTKSTEVYRVMIEAFKSSVMEDNLRKLTDEIGGRIPGTVAMVQAIRWAQSAFREAGGENIHTESFQIPHSWEEGRTSFFIESPVHFEVRGISVAWAPALAPALEHARIVDIGEGTFKQFRLAGDISHCIVLIHTRVLKTWDDLFEEYTSVPPIVDKAVKGGAAAIVFIGAREHDLLYRHTNTQNGRIDRIPQLIVAREDGLRIARLLAQGRKVYGRLLVPNKIGEAFQTSNVIAEIRGSENPKEFVVLGAHLDSWELGTGALDNGCNAALVVDVLRAIHAAGVRPRRTIRFVLFSGEEEGLLGSQAYTRQHQNELNDAVAAIIFDSGSGRVTDFTLSGRKDLATPVRDIIAPLKSLGVTEVTQDADIGTDNFDFVLQGVPTLEANQDPANYMENYHAASDTFDKVDLTQMRKSVAAAAAVALSIANATQRLGARQDRAEISQLLQHTHLDQQMKLFGIWEDWESGKRGRTP
jgi:carboxypeptidase Q